MNNYLLAKLVQWAETLRTRKRMQKVVFLLQEKGCPFNADYRLHHFGPYSRDVAEATDELVQLGQLQEDRVVNPAGQQFNYSLTPEAESNLAEIESDVATVKSANLERYEPLARKLLEKDVPVLEVASTVAYFWQREQDWEKAIEQTCRFKHLKPEDHIVERSRKLAEELFS